MNKRLMKAKLKYYKNTKREQEHDLDMKNQDFLNEWKMPPFIG